MAHVTNFLPALFLIVAAPAAWADGAAEAIGKVGLAGTWSANCAAPVSSENPSHRYFRDENGRPRLQFNPGNPSGVRASSVETVSVLSPEAIRLTITLDASWGPLEGSVWTHVIHVVPGRSHRTLESIRRDGRVTAKDGVIAASGNPTPTFYRCDDAGA